MRTVFDGHAVTLMDKRLLRINEAATIAGIGRSTAYEFVQAGIWPSVKIGRALRIPRKGLDEWIELQEAEAEQRAALFRGETP